MARFNRIIGKDVRVWFGDHEITGLVRSISTSMEGYGDPGLMTIEAYQSDDLYHAVNDVAAGGRKQDKSTMATSSTKEQVEVRTSMADLVKEAIETKYGKVRTWLETETVGPLGGVSAQVFGAVEHEGKVVPFAVSIYSDDRIKEKVEEVLEQEAEDGILRGKLGWGE